MLSGRGLPMTKMPGEQTLTFDLDLPWPPAQLSPNRRQHWAKAAAARKAYRARCRAIAAAAGVGAVLAGKERLEVALTFFPPDRRGRDWDNMLASMKSGLDGLADATGIDDRHWRLSFDVDAPVPGGQVLVRMTC
jgi:crossover junction endodeoxyribonuclease RusA